MLQHRGVAGSDLGTHADRGAEHAMFLLPCARAKDPSAHSGMRSCSGRRASLLLHAAKPHVEAHFQQ